MSFVRLVHKQYFEELKDGISQALAAFVRCIDLCYPLNSRSCLRFEQNLDDDDDVFADRAASVRSAVFSRKHVLSDLLPLPSSMKLNRDSNMTTATRRRFSADNVRPQAFLEIRHQNWNRTSLFYPYVSVHLQK